MQEAEVIMSVEDRHVSKVQMMFLNLLQLAQPNKHQIKDQAGREFIIQTSFEELARIFSLYQENDEMVVRILEIIGFPHNSTQENRTTMYRYISQEISAQLTDPDLVSFRKKMAEKLPTLIEWMKQLQAR